MLIHYDASWAEVQVREGRSHPTHDTRGASSCPVCGSRLIGHGWRTRNITDIDCKSALIWVHRMLCPSCGRAFTLLPSWVHPLKIYSLDAIIRILEYRLVHGHKDSTSGISRYLQERWHRSFETACRLGGCGLHPGGRLELLHSIPLPAGHPAVTACKDRASLMALETRPRAAHHRLHLLWNAAPS